ncbi:Os03g0259201 [Oryza sativa Japonica Group]|uniref:Os03g0259201 protein n=1 Tax=Oryza sativa subsp. japonica TaxID=39947 RepID=A0A0P0VVM2_ORYSJ|nr:Os03g0259201 [Oryza sativa Japonica Group]
MVRSAVVTGEMRKGRRWSSPTSSSASPSCAAPNAFSLHDAPPPSPTSSTNHPHCRRVHLLPRRTAPSSTSSSAAPQRVTLIAGEFIRSAFVADEFGPINVDGVGYGLLLARRAG